MSIRLDIGGGPSSDCEFQVDIVKFPKTTHVLDAFVEDLPFQDGQFDEVRCEQVLEHCPRSLRWREDGKWHKMYPLIHVMSEIHRVLKYGGIAHISVPVEIPQWSQDPTHEGPILSESTFNYFCGQWGGGTPGEFAYESYGITFKFMKSEVTMTGPTLTLRLMKI